jgi:hypothetical protein
LISRHLSPDLIRICFIAGFIMQAMSHFNDALASLSPRFGTWKAGLGQSCLPAKVSTWLTKSRALKNTFPPVFVTADQLTRDRQK